MKGYKAKTFTLVAIVPEMFYNKQGVFNKDFWLKCTNFSIPCKTQGMEEKGAVGQRRWIEQDILSTLSKKYNL